MIPFCTKLGLGPVQRRIPIRGLSETTVPEMETFIYGPLLQKETHIGTYIRMNLANRHVSMEWPFGS